jgi:hypothetical protein
VVAKRATFVRWHRRQDPRRLVFLDEAGANLAIGRSHGWVQRGEDLTVYFSTGTLRRMVPTVTSDERAELERRVTSRTIRAEDATRESDSDAGGRGIVFDD